MLLVVFWACYEFLCNKIADTIFRFEIELFGCFRHLLLDIPLILNVPYLILLLFEMS